jgi:DNA-binding NarL/FixJ family response regulator
MNAAGSLLKVLVVDDHDIVRLGVRHLLGASAQVTDAATVREALDWLAGHPCDLVLLDLNLGDDFGLAALPRLRDTAPGAKIVVLTSMAEDLYAERALRAGAQGFVMKSALGETLREAVDTVLAGQVYLSPSMRSTLLLRVAGGGARADGRPELSTRELEVLRLTAEGQSTREIAETLNRSVKTIETHKQALKTKLGAETPAQLLRLAVAWFDDAR